MDDTSAPSSKKFIVITSIYAPGLAVEQFSSWPGWQTVVVGDRKTPADWSFPGVTYLSIEEQERLFPELSAAIPKNTYTRKMLGYLYAISRGAEAIFESDDDNIPYSDAQTQVEAMLDQGRHPEATQLSSSRGWVNVYPLFGSAGSWPRGFPLHLLKDDGAEEHPDSGSQERSVIQFLADKDPDVDAVYRMVKGEEITFQKEGFYTLAPNTFSPFNSQATLWTPRAFPLMFFPLGVPDRVTDILRGYMALASLWKLGHTLAFHGPTVYQERNPHDLHKDFVQESMLYLHAPLWAEELGKISGESAQALFAAAIERLIELGHLEEHNRAAYRQFMTDLDRLTPSAN